MTDTQDNNELFQITPSKSPKLKWMDKHWIKTEIAPDGRIRAIQGLCNFAYRSTEDEALTHAAQMLNIRLWNEE